MSASLTAASVTPRSSAPLRSRRRSRAVVAASSAPAPGSSGPRSADADDAAVDAAAAALPRRAVFGAALSLSLAVGLPAPGPALAIGFQKELKKRDVSDDDYLVSPGFAFRGQPHDGLRFYDQARGDGAKLEAGKTAVVHFTCRYRGLTAVSSREARTLGGNRTIAEPLEFKYGALPSDYAKPLVRKTVVGIGAELRVDPELRELYVVNTVFDGPADKAGIRAQDTIVSIDGVGDLIDVPIAEIGTMLSGEAGQEVTLEVRSKGSADVRSLTLAREATAVVPKKRVVEVEGGGGLFTGASGPKAPPAVYVPEALAGMRVGGRRSVIVPADVGYEDVGEGEIPPGATFKLEVELLEIR